MKSLISDLTSLTQTYLAENKQLARLLDQRIINLTLSSAQIQQISSICSNPEYQSTQSRRPTPTKSKDTIKDQPKGRAKTREGFAKSRDWGTSLRDGGSCKFKSRNFQTSKPKQNKSKKNNKQLLNQPPKLPKTLASSTSFNYSHSHLHLQYTPPSHSLILESHSPQSSHAPQSPQSLLGHGLSVPSLKKIGSNNLRQLNSRKQEGRGRPRDRDKEKEKETEKEKEKEKERRNIMSCAKIPNISAGWLLDGSQ